MHKWCMKEKALFECSSSLRIIFSSKLVSSCQNSCIHPPILWIYAFVYATLKMGGNQNMLHFSLNISQLDLTTLLTVLHIATIFGSVSGNPTTQVLKFNSQNDSKTFFFLSCLHALGLGTLLLLVECLDVIKENRGEKKKYR